MERHIGREIRGLSNLIKRRIDSQAAMLGIEDMTGVQGWLLHYLDKRTPQGQVFQRDIEEDFGIRRSTATVMLQQLERKGLVERLPVAGDARLKSIVLTEKASEFCRVLHQDRDKMEAIMRKDITPEELAAFFAVADKIRSNLENCENTEDNA
ncbi:Transcriptional regulator SlyA [bioreactor metagenome]|uniref:Transcriptional regulator SlyA n=1 Tax=bioreactor metagenome TaxID=1076179 RepID=A0A645AJM2_9ZZZZ